MEQKEIEENNKLIAEFMGFRKEVKTWRMFEREVYSSDNFPPFDNMEYDGSAPVPAMLFYCSWDWLMPVIEKICNKIDGYSAFHDEDEEIQDLYEDLRSFDFLISFRDDRTFHLLYEIAIDFIKWYNKNVKQKEN